MIKEDFVIQATVRRLLVRSNIDYSDLTFGTVRGVVYFRGIFKLGRIYIYGEDEKTLIAKSQDYIRKTLYSLEKKVRSIPGVTRRHLSIPQLEKRGRAMDSGEGEEKGSP